MIAYDPGETLGWAMWFAYRRIVVVGSEPSLGFDFPTADTVIIERPPIAARRAMDRGPYYSAGAILHAIYPQEPVWQDPACMNVAKPWVKFKRGAGISQHAKDAILHLVYWASGR